MERLENFWMFLELMRWVGNQKLYLKMVLNKFMKIIKLWGNMNFKREHIIKLMVLLPLIFLSSFIKISFLSGSHKFFFSGINVILPVIGSLFNIATSGFIIFVFLLLKKLTVGGAITLGLPTLVATIYISLINNYKNNFKTKIYNFLLSVILPLTCMVLFIIHPAGNKAYLYSFYWLIPVILYFVQKLKNYKFIYLNYLTATFLAHAVGSIIWLYTVPMTLEQWISLIPVVFVERFIFTYGLYYVVKKLNDNKIFKTIKNVISKKFKIFY
jgi:hypothetical protein